MLRIGGRISYRRTLLPEDRGAGGSVKNNPTLYSTYDHHTRGGRVVTVPIVVNYWYFLTLRPNTVRFSLVIGGMGISMVNSRVVMMIIVNGFGIVHL